MELSQAHSWCQPSQPLRSPSSEPAAQAPRFVLMPMQLVLVLVLAVAPLERKRQMQRPRRYLSTGL